MEFFAQELGNIGILMAAVIALNLVILGLKSLPGVGRKTRKRAQTLWDFDERRLVGIIGDGNRFAPDCSDGDKSEHSVTWPMRAVTIALTAVIIYQFAVFIAEELAGTGFSVSLDMAYLFGPLLLYINLYQWLFKVQIEGDRLSLMTPLFQWRDYDLCDLTDLCDDGNGIYTLRFANQRRARILKYVNGHRRLRESLDRALDRALDHAHDHARHRNSARH